MANSAKNTVDYFPHDIDDGKKMSYIEGKYGNDGYATWFKILEVLGETDYHYLKLNDDVQLMFLASRCKVTEDVLKNIINDLVRLEQFHKELWEEHSILWNQKFIDKIQDAYKKRSHGCNTLEETLSRESIKLTRKSDYLPDNPINSGNPTQTKVKKTKVKKTKVKKTTSLSDASIRLSKFFFDKILENSNSTILSNLNQKDADKRINSWAKDIDLMIRIDKRSEENIEKVIAFATGDSFWRTNILGGVKLRKQFDQLFLKMNYKPKESQFL